MVRWRGGKLSATNDCAQGTAAASPIPTPIRARLSVTNPVAAPPSAVIADHSTSPLAMTFLRVNRSAIPPMAMPTTE